MSLSKNLIDSVVLVFAVLVITAFTANNSATMVGLQMRPLQKLLKRKPHVPLIVEMQTTTGLLWSRILGEKSLPDAVTPEEFEYSSRRRSAIENRIAEKSQMLRTFRLTPQKRTELVLK
jgi:hypothetical protein